jgi:hypothetical protein
MLVVVAVTGLAAAPVVASVVAPSLVTQVAQQGLRIEHHHFEFHQQTSVRQDEQAYMVYLQDGDLYEMPLTTQVVLHGAVVPAPDDAQLRGALQEAIQRWSLPVLSYDVQRDGSDVTIQASLPAGILANLSPQYQHLLAKYETPS